MTIAELSPGVRGRSQNDPPGARACPVRQARRGRRTRNRCRSAGSPCTWRRQPGRDFELADLGCVPVQGGPAPLCRLHRPNRALRARRGRRTGESEPAEDRRCGTRGLLVGEAGDKTLMSMPKAGLLRALADESHLPSSRPAVGVSSTSRRAGAADLRPERRRESLQVTIGRRWFFDRRELEPHAARTGSGNAPDGAPRGIGRPGAERPQYQGRGEGRRRQGDAGAALSAARQRESARARRRAAS